MHICLSKIDKNLGEFLGGYRTINVMIKSNQLYDHDRGVRGCNTASVNLYQFFLKIKRREVLNFIKQLKERFS